MKEISKEDANNVSGGMKWHGMRESKNVIDTRSGVAKTYYMGKYRYNPFATYKYFGRFW
ncbi:hypothetical protein H9A57_004593 [Salmonella enterica]|nr:hypothetical protein [Salmonella enterica]EGH3757451.1 hypothetical protein [Salmonella enterica]EIM6766243.1 hypothetical protein [Salmonella enterica]